MAKILLTILVILILVIIGVVMYCALTVASRFDEYENSIDTSAGNDKDKVN